jgi:hypothetical protein
MPGVESALSLSLSLFMTLAPASAGTSEPFGDDLVLSGCGSQWFAGACESGWVPSGADNTLDMCTADSGSNYGVSIHPPDFTSHGIGQEFTIANPTVMVDWVVDGVRSAARSRREYHVAVEGVS